jgi:tetratricopeptide (TPR) repeat protein
VKPLEHPDVLHLQAARGWLELGNHLEADRELDEITASSRAHPDVLEVRWQVYAQAKRWDACIDIATAITTLAPDRAFGWVHRAFALHELKRTQEAWDNLIAVVDRFPDEYMMRYNLARYAAQLGRLEDAKLWLERAFEVADYPALVKLMALDDPNLERLWKNIGRLKA